MARNKTNETSRRFLLLLYLIVILMAYSPLVVVKNSFGEESSTSAHEKSQPKTEQDLRLEKLRQEVSKLELENKKLRSFWGLVPSYATFITAMVAVAGVFFTIWKQINENRRQRELDREQRELDREQRDAERKQREVEREQRATESQRRLDEKFTSVVDSLGSTSLSIQASAAVSIMTFLKSEYKDFHDQVRMILLANLKVRPKVKDFDAINQLLVQGLEKAIRIKLQALKEEGGHLELNLSRVNLYKIDLSDLNLEDVDLGFSQLRLANFTNANLFRARGYKANLERARLTGAQLGEARFQEAHFKDAHFHKATLVSSDFKKTNLSGAQFYQSKLQSAHLEYATLVGAKFEEANLSDAYFFNAEMDDICLKSILKASKSSWQKAHFDEKVRSRLVKLADDLGYT